LKHFYGKIKGKVANTQYLLVSGLSPGFVKY
jgi:hypothetical protein